MSFTPEEIASGKAFYNYQQGAGVIDEMSGRSVFYRDEDGQIFHTYSSFARGGEMFLGSYAFLDITPEGTRRNHQRQPHRLGAPSRPLRRQVSGCCHD